VIGIILECLLLKRESYVNGLMIIHIGLDQAQWRDSVSGFVSESKVVEVRLNHQGLANLHLPYDHRTLLQRDSCLPSLGGLLLLKQSKDMLLHFHVLLRSRLLLIALRARRRPRHAMEVGRVHSLTARQEPLWLGRVCSWLKRPIGRPCVKAIVMYERVWALTTTDLSTRALARRK